MNDPNDIQIQELTAALNMMAKYVDHLTRKPKNMEEFHQRVCAAGYKFSTECGGASKLFNETGVVFSGLEGLAALAWKSILENQQTP